MDIQYVYTRKRHQISKTTAFSDLPAETLAEIRPNLELLKNFIYRNPVDIGIQNSIQYSEHEINTMHYNTENKNIHHTEGGWPKDVNIEEQDQVTRYRKKIEKDELYLHSLQRLIQDLEKVIQQNNAIDIHQGYFQHKIDNDYDESFHVKTVNLYSHHPNVNQMVNHISWQTDGHEKIVASYANLDFPSLFANEIIDSLLWDIENPNEPELIFKGNSSLTTVEFNPKDHQQILGGCLNGQVCSSFERKTENNGLFDVRKGKSPIEQSRIEQSHREPVRNAFWLQSKSGTEFFSAAADGTIYWWDTKKFNEPVDKLLLDLEKKDRPENVSPITKLEYDSTIPTKFMVGTETGRLVLCARKGKSDADRINVIYPGHSGPIVALQRHPFFNKTFLSVGESTTKIWSEEIRDDFILSTRPEKCALTDGQWSPSRPAVFINSTREGSIQIWDLLFKQDEPSLIVKLCEESISCLSFDEQGKYLSCGSTNGNIILIELSNSLTSIDRNEKQLVASMFDRETRRTRLLEIRSRQKHEKTVRKLAEISSEELIEQLQQTTEEFLTKIREEKVQLEQFSKDLDDFSH